MSTLFKGSNINAALPVATSSSVLRAPTAGELADEIITAGITAAVNDTGILSMGEGTYKMSGQFDLSALSGFDPRGEVVLDFRDVTDPAQFAQNAYMRVSGGGIDNTPMQAQGFAEGASDIIIDPALNPVAGDWFGITDNRDGSWLDIRDANNVQTRPYYKKGQYFQIAEVDGQSVDLMSALYDEYEGQHCTIYKHPAKRFYVGKNGVVIILESEDVAMNAMTSFVGFRCAASRFDFVKPTNPALAAFGFEQCIAGSGNDYDANQFRLLEQGLAYGMAISNCQHMRLGGNFSGERHGATLGGGAPDDGGEIVNRDCYLNGTFRNSKDAGDDLGAFNIHGNSEHCGADGFFDGGVNLGGDFTKVGGTAIGRRSQGGQVVYCGEFKGANHDMGELHAIGYGDPKALQGGGATISVGATNAAMSAQMTRGGTIILPKRITAKESRNLIGVTNHSSTTIEPINVDMSGMIIDAPLNTLIQVRALPNASAPDLVSMTGFRPHRVVTWSVGANRVDGWKAKGVADVGIVNPGANDYAGTVTVGLNAPVAPNIRVITKDPYFNNSAHTFRLLSATKDEFRLQVFKGDTSVITADASVEVEWVAECIG